MVWLANMRARRGPPRADHYRSHRQRDARVRQHVLCVPVLLDVPADRPERQVRERHFLQAVQYQDFRTESKLIPQRVLTLPIVWRRKTSASANE